MFEGVVVLRSVLLFSGLPSSRRSSRPSVVVSLLRPMDLPSSSSSSSPPWDGGELLLDPTAAWAMGADWTKERLQLLVSLYANEELLWNTTFADYHHKERRREAFERIASAMDLPLNVITKKVRHIRTYYTKELHKMKMPKDGRYKSRWPLFKLLNSFLCDHVQQRKSSLENESATDDDERGDVHSEHFKLLMGQPTVIKSSLPSPADSVEERLSNNLQNHISKKSKLLPGAAETPSVSSGVSNTYASRLEDPDELFGRHVANELRLIKNIKAKQFAKLQIHNILFNAQFGLAAIPQDIGIPTTVSDSLKKCIDKIAQNERL